MKTFIALAFVPAIASAQSTGPYRGPIIDVHLHAHTNESLAPPLPNPATGQASPKTAEEHRTRSLQIMKERNVVIGIVSGSSVAAVEPWEAAAPDRILKGPSFDSSSVIRFFSRTCSSTIRNSRSSLCTPAAFSRTTL